MLFRSWNGAVHSLLFFQTFRIRHQSVGHFDSYGVGENLITSASDPVFGGVYKLVEVKQPDGGYTPKMMRTMVKPQMASVDFIRRNSFTRINSPWDVILR